MFISSKQCNLFRYLSLMQRKADFSSGDIKVYGLYSQYFFDVQNNPIPPSSVFDTEARNCLELEFLIFYVCALRRCFFSSFLMFHCRTLDSLETHQKLQYLIPGYFGGFFSKVSGNVLSIITCGVTEENESKNTNKRRGFG